MAGFGLQGAFEGQSRHRSVRTVDARGHRCPTPTLRLRRALAKAAEGDVVELIADDPLARIDVPHFARQSGHELVEIAEERGVMRFKVKKTGGDGAIL